MNTRVLFCTVGLVLLIANTSTAATMKSTGTGENLPTVENETADAEKDRNSDNNYQTTEVVILPSDVPCETDKWDQWWECEKY